MSVAKPIESFGYLAFCGWAPARQRKWLSEMARMRVSNQLSKQQLQTLQDCERAFRAGL